MAASHWTYRRLFSVTVAALVLIAGGVGALAARQPPRVGAAQLDGAYAIAHRGSQLVLDPNQPIRTPRHLRVRTKPETDATVRYDRGRFVVAFGQPLRFDTAYHVSVTPVTGKDTGATGTLTYRFRTPMPPLFTLIRSGVFTDHRPDKIIEVLPGTNSARTVFASPSILEYADLGTSLVVSIVDHGTNKLVVVGPNGHVRRTDVLGSGPDTPVLGLRGDPRTGIFGYITRTHGPRGGNLELRDLAHPASPAVPVLAVDGTPMEVINWGVVPGAGLVVVQDSSGQVFVVNPRMTHAHPTLLGTFGRLTGFLPNTTILTLPNDAGSGTRLLDPLHGVARTVPPRHALSGANGRFTTQQLLLDEKGRLVRLDVDTRGRGYVAVAGGGKSRDLLITEPDEATGMSMCLAPDAAHVAVTVQPGHQRTDGYPVQPAREGTRTYIIDTADGVIRHTTGSQPQWCGSGPTSNAVTPD